MVRGVAIPDLGDGHGLLHVVVEDVACLASEGVEDSDCAITVSGSNILVIRVESDTEGLLGGVTQGVLVGDLDVRVLHYLQTTSFNFDCLTRMRPRGESDCPPPWPYRSSSLDCCCF